MHKGIPIAIVRLRQKTVRHKTLKQYVQYFLKLMPEDDSQELKHVNK